MKAKGIIMEQHKHYTIVMTNTGAFLKAKHIKNGLIGEEVNYERYELINVSFFKKRHKSLSLSLACIVLLLAIPTYFFLNGHQVYAYIHIDINPSVEIEVDKHWNVQSIHSINHDGLIIINELSNYKGKKADHVIQLVMEKSEQVGLLTNGKNILIGVSYVKDSVEDEQFLTSLITEDLEWEIATVSIPNTIRKTAKKENKSMNELVATQLEEAKEIDQELQVNETDKKLIKSFYEMKENVKKVKTEQVNKKHTGNQSKTKIIEQQTNKKKQTKTKHENQLKQKQKNTTKYRNHKHHQDYKSKHKKKSPKTQINKQKQTQNNNAHKEKNKRNNDDKKKNISKNNHKSKDKNKNKYKNKYKNNNKHKNKNKNQHKGKDKSKNKANKHHNNKNGKGHKNKGKQHKKGYHKNK